MTDDAITAALAARLVDMCRDVEPALAIATLARVVTGYLAAICPTEAHAQIAAEAVADDMRRAIRRHWASVELLRARPEGRG